MNSTNAPTMAVPSFGYHPSPSAMLTAQPWHVVLAHVDPVLVYLQRACAFIFGSPAGSEIDADRSSYDSVKQFISDPQCRMILVSETKLSAEDVSIDKTDCHDGALTAYTLISSLPSFSVIRLHDLQTDICTKRFSLVVLKLGATIVSDRPYQTQLRIIRLADSSDSGKMTSTMSSVHAQSPIEIPQAILTTRATVAEVIRQCLDEYNYMEIAHTSQMSIDDEYEDDCEEDDDEEMVLFQFVFSSALNNEQRALVFDAMLAYGIKTVHEIEAKAPLKIKKLTDPALVYQPGEPFSVVFEHARSYICFQAWVSRTFRGCKHILTITEPSRYAMNVIV